MAAPRGDERDLVTSALFQVYPGGYDAYWYGAQQKPRKPRISNLMRRLAAEIARVQRLELGSGRFTVMARRARIFRVRSQRPT